MFPTDDYANRGMWMAYLPHALRVLGSAQDCDAKEKSKLCLWAEQCLHMDVRIPKAAWWLEECCRRREGLADWYVRLAINLDST
jgi:hypothetical protein